MKTGVLKYRQLTVIAFLSTITLQSIAAPGLVKVPKHQGYLDQPTPTPTEAPAAAGPDVSPSHVDERVVFSRGSDTDWALVTNVEAVASVLQVTLSAVPFVNPDNCKTVGHYSLHEESRGAEAALLGAFFNHIKVQFKISGCTKTGLGQFADESPTIQIVRVRAE